ncbi:SemiSWEET transporter [Neptunicella sp. SCSIO 80796]|uniref:SemiSWEET transporter n=1 Tax=Neptunicella plasticusilytica TaxID=3117012 RepID=UPI003A4E4B81
MNLIDSIGFIAAFCTTFSFAPQVLMVIKTGDTSSLSLAMYIVFTAGVALWLGYGILRGDVAVIAANALTLVLASIILYKKIYNDFFASRSDLSEVLHN